MGNWTLFGLEVGGRWVVSGIFVGLFALGANWRLFLKSGQPGWAAFVPGYNVVIAMRILGRPAWHAALFLVPIFNVYLVFKTITELAQAFGKHTTLDYCLAIFFNVFYVLNLALSEDEEYQGPPYGKVHETKPAPRSEHLAHV